MYGIYAPLCWLVEAVHPGIRTALTIQRLER